MTIRFKNNNSATDIVSIESEMMQLEAVIIALESAEVNPEIASLLYGSEVSTESFGVKVKDTAKKIWEAIVAFFKKLFNYGDRTEKKAKDVVKETTDVPKAPTDLPLDVNQQHKLLEDSLRLVGTIEHVHAALDDTLAKCPDLPAGKTKAMVLAHYKYYGNILFGLNISDIFRILVEATDKYIKDRDNTAFESRINDVIDYILDDNVDVGPTPRDDLYAIVQRIAKVANVYKVDRLQFHFDRSAFKVDVESLRGDLSAQIIPLANWNEQVEHFESNYRFAKDNDLAKEKYNLKLTIILSKTLINFIGINADYLKAVYEYRKHFSE